MHSTKYLKSGVNFNLILLNIFYIKLAYMLVFLNSKQIGHTFKQRQIEDQHSVKLTPKKLKYHTFVHVHFTSCTHFELSF